MLLATFSSFIVRTRGKREQEGRIRRMRHFSRYTCEGVTVGLEGTVANAAKRKISASPQDRGGHAWHLHDHATHRRLKV